MRSVNTGVQAIASLVQSMFHGRKKSKPAMASEPTRISGYGLLDRRFLVTGIVGEGGNGTVFKAVDLGDTQNPVCIKVSASGSLEARTRTFLFSFSYSSRDMRSWLSDVRARAKWALCRASSCL